MNLFIWINSYSVSCKYDSKKISVCQLILFIFFNFSTFLFCFRSKNAIMKSHRDPLYVTERKKTCQNKLSSTYRRPKKTKSSRQQPTNLPKHPTRTSASTILSSAWKYRPAAFTNILKIKTIFISSSSPPTWTACWKNLFPSTKNWTFSATNGRRAALPPSPRQDKTWNFTTRSLLKIST